jgi:integrase/recombinase XerD
MNAIEWIRHFENYLTLVKNRSNNTVKSYIIDAELLYRFATTGQLGKPRVKVPLAETDFDWATFNEDTAVEYLSALRASGAKDLSVARKVYSLRQFFKFLRKKRVTTADPWADMELHAVKRKLPATLSINEMNKLLTHIRQPLPAFLGIPNEVAFLTIRDLAFL